MTLFDTVSKINEQVRRQLQALWDQYEEEEITLDEFVDLGAAFITAAAARARAIGDLSVAAQLTQLRKTLEVPTGADIPSGLHAKAAAALREQTETQSFQLDPSGAMGIAAAAVVMGAMQESIVAGLKERKRRFYERTSNPDACEVCNDMDGNRYPLSKEFWHHKGCQCMPTVIEEEED